MVRILNFDDSITHQENLLKHFHPLIVDLTRIGSSCRISMGAKMAKEIRHVLRPELRSAITLLGSGDFHQVSSLLIEQFVEPISVIVFDHHPDWSTLPPTLHCGSWVTHVLKRENVKKLVLLGVSSEDISSPWIHAGNVRALEDDRVEIYPYRHTPTRTLLTSVPDNSSIQVKRGFFSNVVYWKELGTQDLTAMFFHVLERLDTKQVYVSIDKDCLTADHALTNWEEGCFTLKELLRWLHLITTHLDVVGLDIVGDYSPSIVRGWGKATLAHMDRPKHYSARGRPQHMINAINEETNIAILEVVCPAN